MRVIAHLKDNEFPDNGYNHTRKIVRGIVYNDNFEIALIRIHNTDIFGERDLLETPGGGVEKGETLLDGFKREIKEEIGATIDNIEEIGRVVDFYNLIYRRNNNHYYLAHIKSLGENHWTNYEKTLFEGVRFLNIDDAIKAYESFRDLPVNNIVKNRELPILKIAKQRLDLLKEKKQIRGEFLSIRQHIPSKLEKSYVIKDKLLPLLSSYKNIGLYASMDDEVDTFSLAKVLLEKGKNLYYPKVEGENLCFYKIKTLDDLKESDSKFHIKEPTDRVSVNKNDLGVIVVPGVVFDKRCNRLGFGKGYYDRYLKDFKGLKVGICFKEQIVDRLPHSNKDVKMDIIMFDE